MGLSLTSLGRPAKAQFVCPAGTWNAGYAAAKADLSARMDMPVAELRRRAEGCS